MINVYVRLLEQTGRQTKSEVS